MEKALKHLPTKVQANGQHTSYNGPEIVSLGWHADAMTILEIGKPPLLLLVGPPGVGKSMFARIAARSLAQRYPDLTKCDPIVLSCNPEMEMSHLWGTSVMKRLSTEFCPGPLWRAIRDGAVFCAEEFSLLSLECRASLLPFRENPETISNPMYPDETLVVPPSFRIVATSNSEQLACRRNSGIAAALYDGFQTICCSELSIEQIRSFLRCELAQQDIDDAFLDRVIALWNDWRDFSDKGSSGKSYLNYRAAEHLARLLAHKPPMPEARAVEIALINKFLAVDPELHSAAMVRTMLGSES